MKKIHFLTIRICLLSAFLFVFHALSIAQGLQVTGKVLDAAGKPMENVNVKLKGGTTGTITKADGSFAINVPSPTSVLVLSSVGFEEKEVAAGTGVVNVVLNEASSVLTDVVVVGYTSQSRAKTSAAVSKLDKTELANRPSPNPIQAMQGKIPGVSVPVTSGQPGAGATNIIIRGGTKLNVYGTGLGNGGGNPVGSADNTGPLVVVDGVFRSIDDINPDNIESFQVMKDAAATAVYGARGANGVIVITTRGGKFNTKMNITLNHRTTWETQSRDYKYLNAEQYLRLARTTVRNTFDPLDKTNLLNNGGFSAGTRLYTAKGQYGINVYTTALYDNLVAIEGQDYVNDLLARGWQTMDDPINPGTKLIYADNNYQDQLWQTGLSQNTNIGINGGGENANYNVSIGSTDQKGVFVGTRYKRFDVLSNFGFKVSKNAKLEAMVNYQDIQPNFVEQFQNDITRGTRLTPLIRTLRDDGRPHLGELYSARVRAHTLFYDDQRVRTERMVSRLAGDVTLMKGLHFKPSVSYLMEGYTYQFQRDGTPANEPQPGTIRQKNHNTSNSRQFMTDLIMQYDFDVNSDHNFTVLGGFNYTRNTATNTTMGSQRGTNDYIFTINEPPTTVVNGITVSNVTSFGTSMSESKSASYFGQFNYDYKGKYLASASLRYDGFSNFAPENQYALFPAVSAGWNMHREEWFNIKPVSMLKLRASWGQAGLNDLSLTDTYGGYSVSRYALSPGILRANLSNPNLIWETTETLDLAFDAGFFNNRVTLTVDWYNKLTKDRLASKPLPLEAPFSSIRYNNGVLQNKGIEIELGAAVIDSKNFSWRTSFAFAKNDQKILKLPDNGREKNRQGGDQIWDPKSKQLVFVGGFAEGERPFSYYAYKVSGVFATEAEAAAYNAKTRDLVASPRGITTGKHAGDFIFEDLNGDGVIDTKDQVFMGYITPNITGGWQNTFSYKGLSLRVGMDYAMGHMISNGALARSLGQGRAFNEGAPTEALGGDIWQKEGDAGKKYARFSFADFDFGQRNYIRNSNLGVNNAYGPDVSAMIEKGDFLAFREITLTYEMPKDIMKKIHSTGMTVFASVFNVGYLTRYTGINPETYTGFDAVGYPRPRQFTLGATLRF
jgi:TonB-linked SusC/RagA family outer membrane protein